MSGTPKLYEYQIDNIKTTPSPEPPARNLLLETMGISYDMGKAASVTADDTAPPQLPYGPMPKEKTSGKVIPMPQRKVI